MRFEWDSQKNTTNQFKHGVSFSTAKKAFNDENAVELADELHSRNENRYILLGKVRKILFVVYTIRNCDTIRIISARKATHKEEMIYYDHNGISER